MSVLSPLPPSLSCLNLANVDLEIFRVKTKIQQRALAGEPYRGVAETLHRLIRGKVLHEHLSLPSR